MEQQNIFETLGQTLRDGIIAMQDYLKLLRSMGSPQTLRGDVQVVSEILKSVGATSDRLQRLLDNDKTYMKGAGVVKLFQSYADDYTAAIEFGLSLSSLNSDDQTRIRNEIVDDFTRRILETTDRQTEQRLRENNLLIEEHYD